MSVTKIDAQDLFDILMHANCQTHRDYLVVIALNNTLLQLWTSLEHVSEILGGRTVLPAEKVVVFGTNGQVIDRNFIGLKR